MSKNIVVTTLHSCNHCGRELVDDQSCDCQRHCPTCERIFFDQACDFNIVELSAEEGGQLTEVYSCPRCGNDTEEIPPAFVCVYMPVAGWKAQLLVVDEDCGGTHTPHGTGHFAHTEKAAAIREAKHWAKAEELPFIDVCPDHIENAPLESAGVQIAKALGVAK